jgi:hypothetical protein
MSKEIILKNGKITIVDDDIYEKYDGFKDFHINANKNGYIIVTSSLHRLVMFNSGEIESGKYIDHIDRNTLNNQKSNLRLTTPAQSNANRRKAKRKCSSKYKGVFWRPSEKKWLAQLGSRNKIYSIGLFDTEEDAAKAYDIYAKRKFGEYAYLNFPNISPEDEIRVFQMIENPKRMIRNASSIYRGVNWHKENKKWRARIVYKKLKYHLGFFDTQEEAALAYNNKAIEVYGDEARLNKIPLIC